MKSQLMQMHFTDPLRATSIESPTQIYPEHLPGETETLYIDF